MKTLTQLAYIFVGCLISVTHASEFELEAVDLGNGVHALIGPTTDRSYENHGLNANFGVIDTPQGVILIDSGASAMGAAILESSAEAITGKAVRWVINTGSQDHRWLGNAYFLAKGAEVIAHRRSVATQGSELANQLERLKPTLKERLTGTEAVHADRVLDEDVNELVLGGRTLVLHYLADAHFPGDIVVWLPDNKTVFAGDHIYTDRLLSIRPFSNATSWLEAFGKLETLAPETIVPGHGRVTDLAGARASTGDYLAFIVEGVTRLADDMVGLEAALQELADAPQFQHLENFDALHRQNINQAYLRAESGL